MSVAETRILRHFRAYHMGANEMLCFQNGIAKSHPAPFQAAMAKLIRRGFVTSDRRPGAYALTDSGYQASRLA